MPDLQTTPELSLQILVETRQRLVNMQKQIELQIKDATEAIKNELAASGQEKAEIGNYVVTLSVRERATLDKGELVALGVSTETIAKATKTSSYVQLDVRGKK